MCAMSLNLPTLINPQTNMIYFPFLTSLSFLSVGLYGLVNKPSFLRSTIVCICGACSTLFWKNPHNKHVRFIDKIIARITTSIVTIYNSTNGYLFLTSINLMVLGIMFVMSNQYYLQGQYTLYQQICHTIFHLSALPAFFIFVSHH